jgi:hypothetical protein
MRETLFFSLVFQSSANRPWINGRREYILNMPKNHYTLQENPKTLVQKYTLCVFRRALGEDIRCLCLENTRYKTRLGKEEALPSVFRDMYFTQCFMAFAECARHLASFPVSCRDI